MKKNEDLDLRIKAIEHKMECLEFELEILKCEKEGKPINLYNGLDRFLDIKEEDFEAMKRQEKESNTNSIKETCKG